MHYTPFCRFQNEIIWIFFTFCFYWVGKNEIIKSANISLSSGYSMDYHYHIHCFSGMLLRNQLTIFIHFKIVDLLCNEVQVKFKQSNWFFQLNVQRTTEFIWKTLSSNILSLKFKRRQKLFTSLSSYFQFTFEWRINECDQNQYYIFIKVKFITKNNIIYSAIFYWLTETV